MPETKEAPERHEHERIWTRYGNDERVEYIRLDLHDAAVEQARDESDARAERLNEYFCYWLLRAYQSGHREGWEEGPSAAQTMTDLLHVLANCGFDPSSVAAKELLKKKMAYFLQAAAKEGR